jgi:hypothetical protein
MRENLQLNLTDAKTAPCSWEFPKYTAIASHMNLMWLPLIHEIKMLGCTLSSGLFPGVYSLSANVSERSVCSIFIGK